MFGVTGCCSKSISGVIYEAACAGFQSFPHLSRSFIPSKPEPSNLCHVVNYPALFHSTLDHPALSDPGWQLEQQAHGLTKKVQYLYIDAMGTSPVSASKPMLDGSTAQPGHCRAGPLASIFFFASRLRALSLSAIPALDLGLSLYFAARW